MRISTEIKKLKEILKSQTKDKLMSLTYIYPIKGKSKLKKDELVNTLYELMTSEETVYENSIVLAEEFTKIESDNNIDIVRQYVNLGYGKRIVTDNEIKFIIAEEIDYMFSHLPKDIDEDIRRYSLVKSYILSCVRLYGVIEIDFFIKLFNEQNKNEKPLEYEELNLQFNRLRKTCEEAELYANCIISESLLMFEGDIEDLMRRRSNKEFYVPSKEELLKYTDEYYIEKNKEYLEFEKFIYNKVKDKETAQGIVEDIAYVLKFENFNTQGAINKLENNHVYFNSIKDLEKFMKLYINLANNTRNWFNKGNTPKELTNNKEPMNLHKTQVGRNDPCPCGSGKKYKKCCLNK